MFFEQPLSEAFQNVDGKWFLNNAWKCQIKCYNSKKCFEVGFKIDPIEVEQKK
jgi:hypothetical protein